MGDGRCLEPRVQRARHLAHLEGGQKAVADAFFQRVGVNRLSEILVGIGVGVALGRGGQADMGGTVLRCRSESINAPKITLAGNRESGNGIA